MLAPSTVNREAVQVPARPSVPEEVGRQPVENGSEETDDPSGSSRARQDRPTEGLPDSRRLAHRAPAVEMGPNAATRGRTPDAIHTSLLTAATRQEALEFLEGALVAGEIDAPQAVRARKAVEYTPSVSARPVGHGAMVRPTLLGLR